MRRLRRLFAALAVAASPGGIEGWTPIDPPALPGAMAPFLATRGGDILLSWIEPSDDAVSSVRFARRGAEQAGQAEWAVATTIASGADLFVNWADTPGIGVAGNGDLYAHWLRKSADATYAYFVETARSRDGGASWSPLGVLHEDRSPTEHGFVSWAAEGEGIRALWLDGRSTGGGHLGGAGAMSVRSARLGSAIESSELVDDRVCDCCSTTLAATARGALAVYRDRSGDEVRDIAASRRGSNWSAPVAVAGDGWKIDGCPVNGPLVVSEGESVAAAWFTLAPSAAPSATSSDAPVRVKVAFSKDSGSTFEAPIAIAQEGALGRVGLARLADGEVVVTWLQASGESAEIRARRVSPAGAGPVVTLVPTTQGRASGVPRLVRQGDDLVLAWVEEGISKSTSRLRAARFPVAAIPAVP